MKRLFIDTETTGLSPHFNKTLTVGMLLADVEKGFIEILDKNHIFIKHDRYNADPKALWINKINLERHHKIAIPPQKACTMINSFIEENSLQRTPLVGHNIGFDKGFLRSLFIESDNLPKFSSIHEDTIHIFKTLQRRGDIPLNIKATLSSVASFFQVDCSSAHDALADCHITAKVYHKMLGLI